MRAVSVWTFLSELDPCEMSTVLTLVGDQNPLRVSYFPPLELNGSSEIGLLSLYCRNVVPNVTEANNRFYYDRGNVVVVPVGYYPLSELASTLNKLLHAKHPEVILDEKHRKSMGHDLVQILWNPALAKVEMVCCFRVNSDAVPFNLVKALGFASALPAYQKCVAENEMKFRSNDLMRVNCDAVKGCYHNNVPTQTILEFDCRAPPGSRFEEKPTVVTYFAVCEKTALREVGVTLCDQQNRPLRLNGESIVVRLHLRSRNAVSI